MKIYTKTGDQGETSLLAGTRVKKYDPRLEAYGTVDELNSYVGWLRAELENHDQLNSFGPFLSNIQHQLFKIGSHLACEAPSMREKLPAFEVKVVSELEFQIDQMDEELLPLKNFILPGGSVAASLAHVCRTVCRRAERRMSAVGDDNLKEMGMFLFLNRLSDLFFVLARWCNHRLSITDTTWNKDF